MMSDLTKKALSGALIELLKTKRLDRITIVELTETTGVNRQTFYYHFYDIFDLVRWTIVDQYKKLMKSHGLQCDVLSESSFHMVLDALLENRTIVLNAYNSMDESQFRRDLHEILDPAIENQVRSIMKRPLSDDDVSFATSFFSSGYFGILIEWLNSGMTITHKARLESIYPIIQDSLRFLVQRLCGDY